MLDNPPGEIVQGLASLSGQCQLVGPAVAGNRLPFRQAKALEAVHQRHHPGAGYAQGTPEVDLPDSRIGVDQDKGCEQRWSDAGIFDGLKEILVDGDLSPPYRKPEKALKDSEIHATALSRKFGSSVLIDRFGRSLGSHVGSF
jgi:hypothetical protein